MKGQDAHDRFDYLITYPPFGVEWKPAEDAVENGFEKGASETLVPFLFD